MWYHYARLTGRAGEGSGGRAAGASSIKEDDIMRVSKLFGETLREAPADVELKSHEALLRGGYARMLAAGIFSYLPLAHRSLKKIENILREEMNRIGGQELTMPVVHPADIWKRTGRWDAIDEVLLRFRDRWDRDMALALTHEEVVASLAATEIKSYRQLPCLVYQLQTKFRDEVRPRGGLIRTREFVMKDSYSLDRDEAGMLKQYEAHYKAYLRMFARAGLPVTVVKSDVGLMGGSVAHEYMYVTPIGEDTLAICDACGYVANAEVAKFRVEPIDGGELKPLEKVSTPGVTSIESVAGFLGVEKTKIAKAVFFMAGFGPDAPEKLVFAIVRGDMEVNFTGLKNLTKAATLRPAREEEISAAGAVAGFASPVGIKKGAAMIIVDELVARSANLVCGANEADHHLLNSNCGRDYEPDVTAQIAIVYEGAGCPECGAALRVANGVEVGNIFQLGTKYSNALGAQFVDEDGEMKPVIMGSYGIGVGRLLACLAEKYNDEFGLALPVSVAPFEALITAVSKNADTKALAEKYYGILTDAGIETLFDDRDASPGVKFADCDLRGIPMRIIISDRSLKAGGAEFKLRTEKESRIVPLENLADEVSGTLRSMKQALLDAADAVG